MKEKSDFNKFGFLNVIPSFYLSHGVPTRTAEHSNKPLG